MSIKIRKFILVLVAGEQILGLMHEFREARASGSPEFVDDYVARNLACGVIPAAKGTEILRSLSKQSDSVQSQGTQPPLRSLCHPPRRKNRSRQPLKHQHSGPSHDSQTKSFR
jgi:hypothetical protein